MPGIRQFRSINSLWFLCHASKNDTQLAYHSEMKATFVELPPFERTRKDYMNDEAYRLLQLELMDNPTAGDVMEGTGGLRKFSSS